MSLIPFAPLKLVRYPHALAPTLVTLPAMSLIALTLSLPLSRPLGFAHLCRGFPARSVRSIVSRQLPPRSTVTSRLYRPCRSSHSLHSRAKEIRDRSKLFNICSTEQGRSRHRCRRSELL